MTALVPRGYGSSTSYQFNAPYQYTKQSYTNGYMNTTTTFAPPYPTQAMYQPTLNSNDTLSFFGMGPRAQPSIGEQFLMLMYELDAQYRYEQYLRWVERMRRQNAQLPPAVTIPPPLYTTLSPLPPQNIYSLSTNFGLAGMGIPMQVGVNFIPTGQFPFQQSCTGPLTMPPFLYNRVSQPQYSFPIPPPLPQIGSMPLTPPVQQMVMERYSNPVAVLPFPPNWQIPQPMMPNYSQGCQQQSMYPSFPPVPQSYFPPAPQSYIPPQPSCMPLNYTDVSQPCVQQPYVDPNPVLNSGYPSMCRACPPAPPPLNISVTGHHWVQHCCACYQVPTTDANPNDRRTTGRATPLLRHPIVPQYVPDQKTQQQSLHANAPVMMRPWLRKTPPLPPGAILISEEYIDKKDAHLPFDYSGKRKTRRQRSTYSRQRSTPATSRATSTTNSMNLINHRSLSPKKIHHSNNNNAIQHHKLTKSKSTTSESSLSSGLSAEYQKTTLYSTKTPKNKTSSQKSGEAQDVNLQYKFQAQDLNLVDLINRYLKSSSEASTSSLRLETLSDRSPSTIKERSRVSSTTSELDSIKEESNFEQEDEEQSRPSSTTTKHSRITSVISELISIKEEPNSDNEDEKSFRSSSTTKKRSRISSITNKLNSIEKEPISKKEYPKPPRPIIIVKEHSRASSATIELISIKDEPDSEQEDKKSSRSSSSSTIKKRSRISPTTNKLNSIEKESISKKEDEKPPRPPSRSKKPKEKLIIIREFIASSPSTMSTISSDIEFSIIDKDIDSLSTTSTIKAAQSDEDDIPTRNIF